LFPEIVASIKASRIFFRVLAIQVIRIDNEIYKEIYKEIIRNLSGMLLRKFVSTLGLYEVAISRTIISFKDGESGFIKPNPKPTGFINH
jgi:hypothetical protein